MTTWIDLKDTMLREMSGTRTYSSLFYVYEISEVIKFIESKSGMVVASRRRGK